MVLGYTIWSDSNYLFYLIWNIFLAFLPFLVSASLLWYKNQPARPCQLPMESRLAHEGAGREKTYPIIFIFGLVIWLILFPNAPYLITDIIHLGANPSIPFWYDAILLFASAWIGIYLGIYSLFHIEQIFLTWCSQKKTDLIILIIILFSSLGIYLGRFLRWNSWDVFIQPKYILSDILNIFSKPFNHLDAYITIIVFFVFITISYRVWKYVRK